MRRNQFQWEAFPQYLHSSPVSCVLSNEDNYHNKYAREKWCIFIHYIRPLCIRIAFPFVLRLVANSKTMTS